MRPDAVVVGAGFAGLSAAARLAEAGLRVAVFDARPQLGGRATAFRDRATGELVDNGQHVLFGCYHETFAFLRRIGAEAQVAVQSRLRVPYLDASGRHSRLDCPPLPAPLHLLAGVLAWDAIPWRERLAVLRVAGPIAAARRLVARGGTIEVPAGQTVRAWLDAHAQGPALREWLWEPLAVAALNQSPEEAGAAPFLRVLAGLFGRGTRDAAIALPVVPLHDAYAEPARRFVEGRGGRVRERVLVRLIGAEADAPTVEAAGERIEGVPVVLAVPWFAFGNAFGGRVPAPLAPIAARAAAMVSKPIVTVNLWYDRAVMAERFVGLPGRTIQWVFDKLTIAGGGASHLSLVVSGADALAGVADGEVAGTAAREIEEALPGARGARLVRATVIREKRATFSLAPGEPPRPATRTPVRGLYLAGDWIDTGLPGTIESAVVSGHRAADALLADGAGAACQRRTHDR